MQYVPSERRGRWIHSSRKARERLKRHILIHRRVRRNRRKWNHICLVLLQTNLSRRRACIETMNVRLAACEPCRRAKLACGHEKPICQRCSSRGQSDSCAYRERPFKRRRRLRRDSVTPSPTPLPPVAVSPQPHRYPNPGFLGSSSHSAIFNQMSSCAVPENGSLFDDDDLLQGPPATSRSMLKGQGAIDKAAQALSSLIQMDVPELYNLVHTWLDKKVSLPLAEPFVTRCAEATRTLWDLVPTASGSNDIQTWVLQTAKSLLKNSTNRIVLNQSSTREEYFAQMFGENLRWEMLGIFFSAAARAAIDIVSFPTLFTQKQQKQDLIRALTYIGDCCLETCLSLDCLNDLQLILQYESLIIHSQVDGDQSYHSWRRMGDTTSSLFALGYHEKIDETTSRIPVFVAELRRAAFARVYAADNMLAIFLGRPPRIVKTYCTLQLPANIPGLWNDGDRGNDTTQSPNNIDTVATVNVNTNQLEPINYTAGTRCFAKFAFLKEEALALFRNRHSRDQADVVNTIKQNAERQWRELPEHFKLTTNLRNCHEDPFTRDFLVSTRLDYLHLLLLLHLVSLKKISEPDEALLTVAGEMLSHVVEVIILRDHLVNSGVSHIWKVAQYGLPAAGIISLALLNSTACRGSRVFSRSRQVQDLSVLVAEIRTGALIQPGEPNFALFTRATRTIQSLLDSLMAWGPSQAQVSDSQPAAPQMVDYWDPCINFDPWDFESHFWANLAEHPTLLGHEGE